MKTVLLILGTALLWAALASINAGLIGFGVILSVWALLDIVGGQFRDNNKLIWLLVVLAALFFAVIGMGSQWLQPPTGGGENPVRLLTTIVSLLLPVAYFLIGRRQKTGEKG